MPQASASAPAVDDRTTPLWGSDRSQIANVCQASAAAEIHSADGYDYGDEFEYGLDVILDGLERARGRTAT